MYRRRTGDRVSYTADQTRRYFSQLRRYYDGQALFPQEQRQQGNVTIYRFRSDRAQDGFWEVRFQPGSSGGNGFPFPGSSMGTPYADNVCMPNLQYVEVTIQDSQQDWYASADQPGMWITVVPSAEPITEYYRFGSSTIYPPGAKPATYLGSCADLACESDCETCMRSETVNLGGATQIQFYVCRLGSLYGLATSYNGGSSDLPEERFWTTEGTWNGGGIKSWRQSRVNITYHYGSSEPLSRARQGLDHPVGPYGGSGGHGGDPFWLCNCPDQTQRAEALPNSPFNSEKRSRDWSGSNTHDNSDGPCKHIYAAANFRGQPFARPAGGNYWDYPHRPQRIRLDWDFNAEPATPSPANRGDWSEDQYRAWRDRMRGQRRAERDQRRAERQAYWDNLNRAYRDMNLTGDDSYSRYLRGAYRRYHDDLQALRDTDPDRYAEGIYDLVNLQNDIRSDRMDAFFRLRAIQENRGW